MVHLLIFLQLFILTTAINTDDFLIHNPVPESLQNESLEISNEDFYVTRCGSRNGNFFSRIVGGHESLPGEFPWLVSIQLKYKNIHKHICGGTIINSKWVLSAAHCVFDLNITDISVVAGDHNLYVPEGFEQRRSVSIIKIKNFDETKFENDISLLKLKNSLIFNDHVAAICLPSLQDEYDGNAIVAGWGQIGENTGNTEIINYLSLPLLNKTICDDSYKRIGFSRFLNNCQICAGYLKGGKDACQGDSGGPLMCRQDDQYYICGLVSWGVGCARPAYPGIYTKITCFSAWIQNMIKNN